MRVRLALLAALAAVAVAPAGAAVAKWPFLATVNGGRGVLAPGGGVRYVSVYHRSGTTTVTARAVRSGRVLRSTAVAGAFGVPVVAHDGSTAGVSADGRTLVLAARTAAPRFAVLATKPLRLRTTVELRGRFSYDAISPNGRLLYLVEYLSATDYRVRAYDLRAGRLLDRVIVDKREAGKPMEGDPVTRVQSGDGSWAFTLYARSEETAFVHALDTVNAGAVCVDLPWPADLRRLTGTRMTLSADGSRLVLRKHGTRLAEITLGNFTVIPFGRP